jgi:hypothetical protein
MGNTGANYGAGEMGAEREDFKGRMANAGRGTMEKLAQTRHSTANAFNRAADALHRNADRLPGARSCDMAHKAASGLESTSRYLRDHDSRAMINDLEQVIRRNPGPAIIGALAMGFLIGRAVITRDRDTY